MTAFNAGEIKYCFLCDQRGFQALEGSLAAIKLKISQTIAPPSFQVGLFESGGKEAGLGFRKNF